MSTKVRLNIVIDNNGDGSASLRFFKNNKLAKAYFDSLEDFMDDDIHSEELEFDEDGELLDKYCLDVKAHLTKEIESYRNIHTAYAHTRVRELEEILKQLDE